MKKIRYITLSLLLLMQLCACTAQEAEPVIEEPIIEGETVLTVEKNGEITEFSMEKLQSLDADFDSVYSAINNWPNEKTHAARGIKLEAILKSADAYDDMQSVTFASIDGYEMSFTRAQAIDMPQYNYIDGTAENEVYSILAYRFKEDCDDLAELDELEDNSLAFVIGQTSANEHTNHAFVEDVVKIIVSTEAPEQWSQTTTFPVEGTVIASGESVKLQHEYFGLVKIHYTTDGTDPTVDSAMYNPSTYQPELNIPITLTEDTVIKTLVVGYGKANSEIQTHEFIVQ